MARAEAALVRRSVAREAAGRRHEGRRPAARSIPPARGTRPHAYRFPSAPPPNRLSTADLPGSRPGARRPAPPVRPTGPFLWRFLRPGRCRTAKHRSDHARCPHRATRAPSTGRDGALLPSRLYRGTRRVVRRRTRPGGPNSLRLACAGGDRAARDQSHLVSRARTARRLAGRTEVKLSSCSFLDLRHRSHAQSSAPPEAVRRGRIAADVPRYA